MRKNNLLLAVSFLVCCYSLLACDKTVVQFGSDGADGDPNVTLIDTFTAELSTLQVDSFSTSSSGYFVVGDHQDPLLGHVTATSYFEVTAPTGSLTDCNTCVFDSIVLRFKGALGYMGDTTVPFTINVNEVTQSFTADEITVGYNVSSLVYDPTPLASKTVSIRPNTQPDITMRLPDALGKNLFRMMKVNSDTLTDNDKFKRFFKGLCFTSSTSNNALYYFKPPTDTTLIKLYYTIAGAVPQSTAANFTISTSDKQFNGFSYNKTGTNMQAFVPKKKELINSSLTGNSAYLHYNSGLFPKISFGSLLSIKELHPYVQVVKAELQIPPASGTYGINSMYNLPAALELRVIDDDNLTTGAALSYSDGTQYLAQEGSLYIDNLYGESTGYTYDATSFINTLLSEGAFSRKALLVYPSATNSVNNDQRLILNNNLHSAKPVKLKLYILGL